MTLYLCLSHRGPIFLGSPDLPSALIGKKELGSLGAPEFRPSSSLPSLFLVGCVRVCSGRLLCCWFWSRSSLFRGIFMLTCGIVSLPAASSSIHLHADLCWWCDRFRCADFLGSMLGLESGCGVNSCSWLLVVCGAASGCWLCSRSSPVVSGSNRGSKVQVCGALSGCSEEDPCTGSSLAVLSSLCFWWLGRVLYWVLVLCLGGVDVCAVTIALPSNVIFVG
ncbi:hypothetical protein ACOSQ4_029045 [Xanthoceras sorbifolium]